MLEYSRADKLLVLLLYLDPVRHQSSDTINHTRFRDAVDSYRLPSECAQNFVISVCKFVHR